MKRVTKLNFIFVGLAVLLSVAALMAQTRPRPSAERSTTNDFKVTYRSTIMAGGGAGQTSESTTMIKGARERSENHSGSGYDTVSILQCDLKRTIQISDTAKKYIITPIQTGNTPPPAPTVPSATGPARRGGVVTYITSSIDTGERKEMFGFTARHVKSSTVIETSPDACNQIQQRTEMDGWYIDLNVALDCLGGQPAMATPPSRSGCQDQTRFRREGNGKIGFPLIETLKVYGPGGQVSFTSTREAVELSRQPLDIALFDIPAGYTEASTQQELYGMPSIAEMMGRAQSGDTGPRPQPTTGLTEAKRPGSILIGVVQINNKTGRQISLETLRQRLVGEINGAGFEAIALNAISQMEAEAEAKAKQCNFILYTDLATLKANKLGGMFGRVAGVEGAGKTEAKVEFKLFAVGESSPRLQSSTSAKEEGDESSAGTALAAEARMVSAEVRKSRP